jgi:hypothetical protein
MFTGVSSLRKEEPKPQEVTEAQKKLQAYLQKYTGEAADEPKKRKKKKKKPAPCGVQILDEDLSGFKPILSREEAAAAKAAKAAKAAGSEESEEEDGGCRRCACHEPDRAAAAC